MYNFAEYSITIKESKFREIEQEVFIKAKETSAAFKSLFNPVKPIDIKEISNKIEPKYKWFSVLSGSGAKRATLLNSFKIKDLKTNLSKTIRVFVVFNSNNSTFAYYDDPNKALVLFYDNIKSLSDSELEAVMVHELTHGIQEYKTVSDEYNKEVTKLQKGKPYNKKTYFSEPIELDAHFTELAYRIFSEFNILYKAKANAKFPETQTIYQKRIEKFLLELKLFIKSEMSTYLQFKELPLPAFFSLHEDFLRIISQNLDLRKALKQKLSDIYDKLIITQT